MAVPNGTTTRLMRLSEAAAAAEVSKQTLEYYIMLGLIEPVRQGRKGCRQRFFDDALVRRVRLIHKLNQTGYALRDIRDTYLAGR